MRKINVVPRRTSKLFLGDPGGPQTGTLYILAQETLQRLNTSYRCRTSMGFPDNTQDVAHEDTASHPAFLSLLHRITLKKRHTQKLRYALFEVIRYTYAWAHSHTKSCWVVSCGVSVLFSLLLYFTYFLGFFSLLCVCTLICFWSSRT